jgi:FKBP-type peptidyl-prolyl cis-trans isomerase (trigger factor)
LGKAVGVEGLKMNDKKSALPENLDQLKERLSQEYANLPAGRRDKLIKMRLQAAQLVDVPVERSCVDLGSENLSKKFQSELFQRTED